MAALEEVHGEVQQEVQDEVQGEVQEKVQEDGEVQREAQGEVQEEVHGEVGDPTGGGWQHPPVHAGLVVADGDDLGARAHRELVLLWRPAHAGGRPVYPDGGGAGAGAGRGAGAGAVAGAGRGAGADAVAGAGAAPEQHESMFPGSILLFDPDISVPGVETVPALQTGRDSRDHQQDQQDERCTCRRSR